MLEQLGVQRLQLAAPVVSVSSEQLDVFAVNPRHQPVAIELDFARPTRRIKRRLVHQRGQLRCQARGQFGRLLRGERFQFEHAVGQFVHHAEVGGGPGVCVAFFDEQPRGLFFTSAFHLHQSPTPAQLVAVQLKLQIAVGQRLLRVAHRSPSACVPDDDFACPIKFVGNGSFKAGVVQRVVLHLHGHALYRWIKAWPLGHRPTSKRAAQLEPKVVVKTAGPVLLDNESGCCARAFS